MVKPQYLALLSCQTNHLLCILVSLEQTLCPAMHFTSKSHHRCLTNVPLQTGDIAMFHCAFIIDFYFRNCYYLDIVFFFGV